MNKKLIVLLIIFALMQIIRPAVKENQYAAKSDFLALENPSDEVKSYIRNACYDCHSNTTNYPWYNKITPINYWLNNHIEEAKEHLSFSDWDKYSVKNKIHALEECIEVLGEKEMPLKPYIWLHPEANLSESDRKVIMIWLQQIKIKYELEPKPM